MKTLKFEISYIDPFSILAYYFININNPFVHVTRTDMMYYFGCYMVCKKRFKKLQWISRNLNDFIICYKIPRNSNIAEISRNFKRVSKDLKDFKEFPKKKFF